MKGISWYQQQVHFIFVEKVWVCEHQEKSSVRCITLSRGAGCAFFFGLKWNEIVEIRCKTKTKRSETTKRNKKIKPKKMEAGIERTEVKSIATPFFKREKYLDGWLIARDDLEEVQWPGDIWAAWLRGCHRSPPRRTWEHLRLSSPPQPLSPSR